MRYVVEECGVVLSLVAMLVLVLLPALLLAYPCLIWRVSRRLADAKYQELYG